MSKVHSIKTKGIYAISALLHNYFCFDSDGRLYVQVHKNSGGLYDHSVGGHVSHGESYDEAAMRESAEELGIVQLLKHIANFYSDEGNLMQHIFGLYECQVIANWIFEPNDEVAEIIPIPLEQITKLMTSHPQQFTSGFINTMKEYLNYFAAR